MGSAISSLFAKLFGKKEMRILMVGLDAAGKTTLFFTSLNLVKLLRLFQQLVSMLKR